MTYTRVFPRRLSRARGGRLCAALLWVPLAVLPFQAGAAPAQPPAPAAPAAGTPDPAVAQLRVKLAAAQTKLASPGAGDGAPDSLPPGATQTEAIEYRSLLQRLAQTYQTHLDDLAAIDTIRQRRQDFERKAQTWTGFSEQPPYSVLFVDDLRDTLQSLENKVRMEETTRAFLERLSADAEAAMTASEGKARRLDEQLESLADKTLAGRFSWLRELEQTRSQAAAATVSSFETKRRKTDEELDESRQRLAFARRQLALAGQNVRFTQADLDKALAHLSTVRSRLKADEREACARLDASRKALADARENLQKASAAPTPAAPGTIRLLQETVETRDAQAQSHSEIVTCLRHLSRGVETECQLWQARFAVFANPEAAELQNARRRLDRLGELVLAAKPYFNQQLALTASQIIELQNALLSRADSQKDPELTRERLEALQQQAEAYRRVMEGLENHERLIQRWKETLAAERATRTLAERLRDFLAGGTQFFSSVWNFELFVVKDTLTVDGQKITGARGITVGKICLAFLILLAGYWLSKQIARRLEGLVISRLRIEPNQANLIRRWSHVILMACVVIFSLVSVKIPLTVFAFAGGALAIGVGFGTQNLLKNFISGIIILFERPFRVGDVLDVAGQRGKITNIGIRSSVLQLWDGTETLIPNSALLENNLTNWTYSNRTVRFTVSVGVAYGSDTRRVAQLLGEVAGRHGLVHKEPKPQVLFTNFGDSNLSFDLLYWVDVLKCNSAQVSSDLRHMIASAFAESGIVMAFPQRDMHLDAAKPLQVQLVPFQAQRPDPEEDASCQRP